MVIRDQTDHPEKSLDFSIFINSESHHCLKNCYKMSQLSILFINVFDVQNKICEYTILIH